MLTARTIITQIIGGLVASADSDTKSRNLIATVRREVNRDGKTGTIN